MRRQWMCGCIALVGVFMAPAPSSANFLTDLFAPGVTPFAGPTSSPYVNWVIQQRVSLGLGNASAIYNEPFIAARDGRMFAPPLGVDRAARRIDLYSADVSPVGPRGAFSPLGGAPTRRPAHGGYRQFDHASLRVVPVK